jgi:superoxide dismutase, Cu-Zn family
VEEPVCIRPAIAVLALILTACDHPANTVERDVDGRRPGSPTDAPVAQRQGDTTGGADSFPAKSVDRVVAVAIDPTKTDSRVADHLVAVVQGTGTHPGLDGDVHFRKTDAGVTVEANIDGLPPGPHAYHVHLYGDCTAPEQDSAGPHLEFATTPAPAPGPSVAGHLGDLVPDAAGKAVARGPIGGLGAERFGFLNGRAVVIHAPGQAGDEGEPIACGVIGVANEKPPTPTPTNTLR